MKVERTAYPLTHFQVGTVSEPAMISLTLYGEALGRNVEIATVLIHPDAINQLTVQLLDAQHDLMFAVPSPTSSKSATG
jgi:hypothetical protein